MVEIKNPTAEIVEHGGPKIKDIMEGEVIKRLDMETKYNNPMLLLEYQLLSMHSGKMIECRLFEVKQHKHKLVRGWVTIWWVVLLI